MPEMNTSSLPDLIFTILFFFMMVTTMREVTLKVKFDRPVHKYDMLRKIPTDLK